MVEKKIHTYVANSFQFTGNLRAENDDSTEYDEAYKISKGETIVEVARVGRRRVILLPSGALRYLSYDYTRDGDFQPVEDHE